MSVQVAEATFAREIEASPVPMVVDVRVPADKVVALDGLAAQAAAARNAPV